MEMNQKECGIVCKENGTEQIEKVMQIPAHLTTHSAKS